MSLVSRALDKLPAWVQLTLGLIAVPLTIYYIAHYGFWHFVLRMILSP